MPTSVANRFLLLYGSQTGQAKAIAEEIAEKAETHNLHADLHCLSLTEKKFFIEREKCVVIVTSTTGDGEPPDTGLKFVRRLKKKTLLDDHLSHMNYALLGLGDSNYTNFCNCGKSLDKRLQDLGAKRFYDSGWADDAVGLEVAVEPWIEGLFPALKSFHQLAGVEHSSGDADRTSFIIESSDITNGDAKLTGSGDVENGTSPTLSNIRSESVTCSGDNLTSTIRISGDNVNMNSNNLTSSTVNNQSDCNNSATEKEMAASSAKQTVTISDKDSKLDNTDSSILKSTEGSIRVSVPPLSESTLTVPLLPPPYLRVEFQPEQNINICDLPRQNGCDFPSAASSVTMATVCDIKTLTSDCAVKKALMLELDISGSDIKYQPGDSFSIICPNETKEIETLLNRLDLLDKVDTCMKISVLEGTKKRNASVPKFVPEVSTLRHIFTTCLDIREPPKKALLRALVECTSDAAEKRRLQELCSKQGNEEYAKYIREPSLSILDILHNFQSCHPSVERLIEHLPRLQPRPYSVCSSPLTSPGKISCVFNVIEIPLESGRSCKRKGVCTGWLDGMTNDKHGLSETDGSVEKVVEKMTLNDTKVPIFARTNQNFHLPDDVTVPLILIGPGTGVAPFIGYLEHRASHRETQSEAQYGEIWLFYGCRHKDRDYLFKDKLEQFVSTSTLTKLMVSFSRDDQTAGGPRYVQDNLKLHSNEIVALVEEKGAVVYVCGDAKNMAKDVNQSFIEIFSKHKGISEDEARKLMMKLRLDKRYKEDVWT